MSEFRVVEIFTSINGEGPRSGQLSLFIRMQGCNLNCSYCDTRWANEPDVSYTLMATDDILRAVKDSGMKNVTLTGGEPLLSKGIEELLCALADEPGIRLEIETNGSIDLKPFTGIGDNISFNMDYKLPCSGMEEHMLTTNFALLTKNDTVKFVVSDRTDLERARALIAEYDLTGKCRVYLSPVFGRIEPEEIVNFMKVQRMNDVTLQLQIHKIIWDPEKRGV